MKKIMWLIVLLVSLGAVTAIEGELVATDPSPPEAGEYVDATIRLSLDDEQDKLTDVSFHIEDTLRVKSLSPKKMWSVALPGEELTATVRLFLDEDLPQGEINLEGRVVVDGVVRKVFIPMYVEESQAKPDLRIGALETVPKEILPESEDNKLTLTLQNLGDREAELLVATLKPLNTDFQEAHAYAMQDSVSSIEGGEEAMFELYFDVETERPKPLEAMLEVSYRIPSDGARASESKRIKLPVTIPMTDTPYLELTKVEQEDKFAVGSIGNMMHLTITNEGNEDASEVRVRLFPDVSHPFAFDRTTRYITAELEPGQSTTVAFEVEVFGTASAQDYPLAVQLESLVGSARYERQETVMIGVKEGRRGGISPAFIVIGIVIVISIGFAIWRFRRRR